MTDVCPNFLLIWKPSISQDITAYVVLREVDVGYASGVMVLAVTNTGKLGIGNLLD